MEYLVVGTIVRTIGLKGEVKIYPSTHFRDSRFAKGSHVFLLDKNKKIIAKRIKAEQVEQFLNMD